MKIRYVLLSLICLLFFSIESKALSVDPQFTFGYDTSLTSQSHQNIKGGSGLLLGGGVIVALSDTYPQRFELESNLTYKFQTSEKENNTVAFRRTQWEILSCYHHTESNFRIGLGAALHSGIEFEGEGQNSYMNEKFKNVIGLTSLVEKRLGDQQSSIGLRYSTVSFKNDIRSIKGDSFGVFYRLYL